MTNENKKITEKQSCKLRKTQFLREIKVRNLGNLFTQKLKDANFSQKPRNF